MADLKGQRAQSIAEARRNTPRGGPAAYKVDKNPIYKQMGRPRDLVISAATAASKWTDWKVVHTEKGPFVNEMLGDRYRWKTSSILSVMVQGAPHKADEATPLCILDFILQQH